MEVAIIHHLSSPHVMDIIQQFNQSGACFARPSLSALGFTTCVHTADRREGLADWTMYQLTLPPPLSYPPGESSDVLWVPVVY